MQVASDRGIYQAHEVSEVQSDYLLHLQRGLPLNDRQTLEYFWLLPVTSAKILHCLNLRLRRP